MGMIMKVSFINSKKATSDGFPSGHPSSTNDARQCSTSVNGNGYGDDQVFFSFHLQFTKEHVNFLRF